MVTAKRYDLRVGEEVLWGLTKADIADLFRIGRISSSTPCRLKGSSEWQNVNEYFPLLKYGVDASGGSSSIEGTSLRSAAGASSNTGRWKIGVACFVTGLACAGAVMLLQRKAVPLASPQPPVSYVQAAQVLYAPPVPQKMGIQSQKSVGVRRATYSDSPRVQPVANSLSRSVQGTIQNRLPVNPPAPSKPEVKPEEITIPLEQWTTVTSAYGSFSVKIRDHGPVTITVWLNYGQPRRIEKEKGFETTGTNIVQIHSLSGARVYYVDRIGVSSGYCVLKIIPNS
ncbi:hypothetical protein ACXR0O_10045 [Verrucomicrobiota bacterium sgz303538]